MKSETAWMAAVALTEAERDFWKYRYLRAVKPDAKTIQRLNAKAVDRAEKAALETLAEVGPRMASRFREIARAQREVEKEHPTDSPLADQAVVPE